MATKAPPLLEQYLALPPEAALIVLSGVVGTSTNWLVLRYLASFLGGRLLPSDTAPVAADSDGTVAVILVSFMRGFSFWRDGAGRLGIDLDSLRRKGRFGFVDGLTGLFAGPAPPSPPRLPAGHLPGANGDGAASPRGLPGGRTLVWDDKGVRGITASILDAIEELRGAATTSAGAADGDSPSLRRRLVLVVDQPDLLLAAVGSQATVADMRDMLLDLREQVYASIITLSADEPLVAAQQTTLEREHASLVLSLAHEADMLLGVRLLDTGTANDVSGVLRVTRGGGAAGAAAAADPAKGPATAALEDHEYLYHVGGDGGVRVFERGQ